MILPQDLAPTALGLQWGWSKAQCLHRLRVTASRMAAGYATVWLPVRDEPRELTLRFRSGDDDLHRIEANLYISPSFWELSLNDEDKNELQVLYLRHFERAKEQWAAILGTPRFAGTVGDPGYPKDQVAQRLAFWDQPAGRVQIEFEHPQPEHPVSVKASCYTPRLESSVAT
jgi:hypothetical protein